MNREELNKNAEIQKEFFNGLAENWRKNEVLSVETVGSFFSDLDIKKGDEVLDVGCGAGVLEEYLLSLGASVDGIDIAEEMIKRAVADDKNKGARFFVADFYLFGEDKKYDYILVFDAYPHFPDKKTFAKKASALLKNGGILKIVFDSGKETINARHARHKTEASVLLKSAEIEAENFSELFDTLSFTDEKSNYSIILRKKIK